MLLTFYVSTEEFGKPTGFIHLNKHERMTRYGSRKYWALYLFISESHFKKKHLNGVRVLEKELKLTVKTFELKF